MTIRKAPAAPAEKEPKFRDAFSEARSVARRLAAVDESLVDAERKAAERKERILADASPEARKLVTALLAIPGGTAALDPQPSDPDFGEAGA